MLYDLLYDYQKRIVNDLAIYDSCALFMDVGTGKSITSLALYEQKIMQNHCNKLLIVCLCAKVEEWKHDCEKWFPFSKVLVIDGKEKSKESFKKGDYDICIINFEKTWRFTDLLRIDSKTMIIIDESHKIKESTTKVGDFMRKLSFLTPYKVILTATPMGNGYIDLYNQLFFLGLLDISLKRFKEKHCIERLMYLPGTTPFKQIVSYKNTTELDLIVNKYARYYERKISDDLVPSEVMVPIKLEEKYNKINKDRVYKDIALDKISMKRIALKSLCSGTIIGNALVDDNDLHREYQLNTYKLDWVKSFLEDFKERVVIFYMYDHQRDQLYDMVTKKLKRHCARYCSEFKEKDIFDANDDCVILVQYKSGSTGVDWLKQSYIGIFYCLPDSYIEFYQAKGRLNRVGQTKKPLYYLLVAQGKYCVDMMNYDALMNKQDFNDEFFTEKMKQIKEN